MGNLIFGQPWNQIKKRQQGKYAPPTVNIAKTGDYGADPIGDGMFKMVPSGEIVSLEERNKRLS
ncbi:hypothetical protein LCGC14_0844730 [marine sediment metagenome]|uniref:Uncharacterized protein n=1 Tax=marine sediment metagenome TaxID=412755 RepID=A0A0F9PGX6_9ZZZZ|nr:hypothetical protein [Pricia sp.]